MSMGRVGKYNGEALEMMDKIMDGKNSYTPNKIYENETYKFYWYINKQGYLHVLRPTKVNANGECTYWSIEDCLLTNKNTLKQTGITGIYDTVEEAYYSVMAS